MSKTRNKNDVLNENKEQLKSINYEEGLKLEDISADSLEGKSP